MKPALNDRAGRWTPLDAKQAIGMVDLALEERPTNVIVAAATLVTAWSVSTNFDRLATIASVLSASLKSTTGEASANDLMSPVSFSEGYFPRFVDEVKKAFAISKSRFKLEGSSISLVAFRST